MITLLRSEYLRKPLAFSSNRDPGLKKSRVLWRETLAPRRWSRSLTLVPLQKVLWFVGFMTTVSLNCPNRHKVAVAQGEDGYRLTATVASLPTDRLLLPAPAPSLYVFDGLNPIIVYRSPLPEQNNRNCNTTHRPYQSNNLL